MVKRKKKHGKRYTSNDLWGVMGKRSGKGGGAIHKDNIWNHIYIQYIMAGITNKKRGLHDVIAGTYVYGRASKEERKTICGQWKLQLGAGKKYG